MPCVSSCRGSTQEIIGGRPSQGESRTNTHHPIPHPSFFTFLQLDDSALLTQQKIAEREEKLKKESQKKDDALIEARRRADDLTRSIADLEEELASVNGRMAQYESGSYMLADAVREVKDL